MAPVTSQASGNIRLKQPSGRWILLAAVLGSSMAMLDATVVNVALPTIGRDLHTSLGGLQWTITAYTLTLAGLILLGGSLGDRMGRRRIFVTGVVWFAVASALCGLAPDIGVLIGARALQGVGGALLTPGSLAIIQASFVSDDRPRAIGAWSGLGGVAGAAGPLLGGWLVGAAGWRWIFLINLPLAAVVVLVSLRHVPETRDPSAHGRFDVTGAVLAALALTAITYALIEAPVSGTPQLVITVAVGVAAAVAFVMVERRRGRPGEPTPPMLPLDVFGSRQFTAVNVVTFVVYAAVGGRHADERRRAAPADPDRAGCLLCGRRAARYLGVRARSQRDRRAADRHRAGQRRRPARRRGQRCQQRGRPGGGPARGGRVAPRGRAQRGWPFGRGFRERFPEGHGAVRGPARRRGGAVRPDHRQQRAPPGAGSHDPRTRVPHQLRGRRAAAGARGSAR